MICDINVWDDFVEGGDTTIQIESTDFSKEVEEEILQYVKNMIAKAEILPASNMSIETNNYEHGEYVHLELRHVGYDDVGAIVELFNNEGCNMYCGIYLNVYAES